MGFHFNLRSVLLIIGFRYCSYLLRENRSEDPIHYSAPLDLVIDAIRSMNPRHLSDPPRSLSRESLPLEDQYQKEFYRSFYTLVDGNVVISPEYVVKTGKGGGTIDFLLPSEKWGIELLRNRNKVVEHMERFTASGAYHAMIDSDVMKHYIVLDFSTSMPQKSRPGMPFILSHSCFTKVLSNSMSRVLWSPIPCCVLRTIPTCQYHRRKAYEYQVARFVGAPKSTGMIIFLVSWSREILCNLNHLRML